MPGLVGVVSTRGRDEAARRFAIARDRMLRHGRMTIDARTSPDGACTIGRLFLGDAGVPASAPAPGGGASWGAGVPNDLKIVVLVHGVLYNSDAARLARAFGDEGASAISRLDGEFALAIVDAHQRLVLATDTIGKYPVYFRHDADGLIFASDLSAVLRATPGVSRLDMRAVADYATLGMVLGDKTLADGVRLLDPGTVLTYDARDGRLSLTPYTDVASLFAPKVSNKAEYFEAVQAEFKRAVGRAASQATGLGLSLSGGLDSRAVLSALGPRTPALRTYTLGVEGCADQAIARRLSAIVGTEHIFFRLDSSYLKDFLPNMAAMVSITDGMYLSHGLTEMLAIQFLDQTGIKVLLRGHGGELAKAHLAWPLHTDQRVYGMSSLDELVPYLSTRSNYITSSLPLSDLMTPDAAKAAGAGSRDSFAAVLQGKPLSPADACGYLYVRELNRRSTVPSLELFRTRVEVRMPYLDPAYLRVLLAAPSEWRDSTDIHRHLTASGMPSLLQVRNSNTGARANAGAAEEYVMDKINTILKRLNVSGYRHYHNFDAWMRRMLLETVEAELLAPTARVQSWVPKPVLARFIQESRDGSADRAYLLQLLLILELWQRENNVGF